MPHQPTAADTRRTLDLAFAPRSVAVVGGVTNTRGMGGGSFLRATKALGIVPAVYGVSPKGGTLEDGSPVYPSLRDVPGDVDYVISAVPASAVLDVLEDARAKNVRLFHLFTAGFRETGDQSRADLEQELLRRARAAGIRILGPNCMGIYSPGGGVNWMADAPAEVGRIGVLSQSGMNASMMVEGGARRGLRFSRAVSYGNALDLIESDFLDYFRDDPGTDLVLCYIEGVRDGPRFVRAMRDLARHKPVAVLKGGSTEAGSRAASSHTGSLAGSAQVWEAVRRQTGFLSVHNVDEILDLAVTVQHLPGVAGDRVAIIGGGGGASVVYADTVDRAGLRMPSFGEASRRRLSEFIPVAGTSVRNPLDAGLMAEGELARAVEILSQDPSVDCCIYHFGVDFGPSRHSGPRRFEERLLTALDQIKRVAARPLVLVMREPQSVDGMEVTVRLQAAIGRAGFAVYPSMERAATALRRYLDWRRDHGAGA